jgi:uncharacterized OsmC-like protein
MSEKVIVRQKRNYETNFTALDPEGPDAGQPRPVHGIHELTPYGMVLAGLGTCTAFVVNSYAEHHNVKVDAVELKVEYQRSFKNDCVNCEEIDAYEEQISMTVSFEGDLTAQERDKLFKISMHCPVHKMLKKGIIVKAMPT